MGESLSFNGNPDILKVIELLNGVSIGIVIPNAAVLLPETLTCDIVAAGS